MFDCRRGVVCRATRGMLRIVAVGWCEGGADAPAGWYFYGGLDRDLFDGGVGGVEEEFFPLKDGELLADARGDDAVEVGVKGGDAGGNGDVELVEVFVVATPRENLAVGGEDDAGDVVDGAGGAMVAGNPFWRGESDGAGLNRNVDFGVVELARSVGEVGGDLDGSFLGLQKGGCREQKS